MNNLTFAGSPLTGAWPEQCPLGHRLEWVTLDGQTWLMCEEWNCRFGKQPGPTREEYPAAFGDPGLSTVQSAYRETILNNVMHLLRSRTLLDRVAGQVQASDPEALSRRIGTRAIPGTDFIILSAADGRPDRAALIANGMALGLVDFYSELNRAEAASARKLIESQLALAQDRLGSAEQTLSEFQSQTGA